MDFNSWYEIVFSWVSVKQNGVGIHQFRWPHIKPVCFRSICKILWDQLMYNPNKWLLLVAYNDDRNANEILTISIKKKYLMLLYVASQQIISTYLLCVQFIVPYTKLCYDEVIFKLARTSPNIVRIILKKGVFRYFENHLLYFVGIIPS